MSEASIPPFGSRPTDRGLGLMIFLSATLHVVAVGTLLLFPELLRVEHDQMPSYTVDLVSPNRIGGTNLPGHKKNPRAALPPAPEPLKPAPEPPKPEPPVAKAEPPPPPPPPPEPVIQKVEPPPPPPKPEVKEQPKPPEPKKEAKVEPKKAEPKDAVSLKKGEKPAKKEEEPKKKEEKVAKKEEPPPKGKAAEKTAKEQKPPPEVSAEQAQKTREDLTAQLRDQRLAEAINKAKEKAGSQPDLGGSSSEPLSIGPGEGAGGKTLSAEAILYQMALRDRVKKNWVWNGSEKTLQVDVRFGIADNGEILDVQVEKSSGNPTYDLSAVRAVKASSPLAAPPASIREQFRDIIYTFVPEGSAQ